MARTPEQQAAMDALRANGGGGPVPGDRGPAPPGTGPQVPPAYGPGAPGGPGQEFRARQAAGIGPQPAPSVRSTPSAPSANPVDPNGVRSTLRDPVGSAFRVGEGTARAAGTATKATYDLGQRGVSAAARGVRTPVGGMGVGSVLAAAEHGNFYFDDRVPIPDKLRVGATDLARGIGGVFGGAFGAGAGSVVPVAGTLAGGVAGGYAGDRAAHWIGNKVLGSDEVLRRNGYDPDRSIIDVGRDLISGKGDDAFGVRAGAANAVAVPTSQPPPSAPSLRAAPPPTATAPPVAPAPAAVPGAPAAAPNVVTRDGNSFSGNGVREGFTYGGDGAPKGGGSLTVMPGQAYPPAEISMAGARAAQRELDAFGPGPHGGGAGSIRGTTLSSEAAARAGMTGPVGAPTALEMSRLPPQTRHELRVQAARSSDDMARAQLQAETQRYGTDMSAAVAGANNETQRYGIDTNAEISLRSQNVTREGHQMTAATARAQGVRDQANKDREFGQSQRTADLAAQQSSEKSWQSAAENRFRTRDDKGTDVPDHQKIGEFNKAVDTTIPSYIKLLRQTGTPEALVRAADLEKRGRAAFGPEDVDHLQRLFDKRSLAAQTDGMGFGSSDYVHSDDLLGYMKAGDDKRLIGGDGEITRNGTRVRNDKLRYGPNGNVLLPNFAPPNTNLTGLR